MSALSFDNLTLITSLVLLILGILTPMLNPFFRFRKKHQHDDINREDPPIAPSISLVLTPYDDADKLEKNLPFFLQQDFPSGYQVVIVIEQKDHDAEDIIGRILSQTHSADSHAEVYVTYIPKSSRYVSQKKLAITLGIKAAKYEWVLVTEASCRPSSTQWLNNMARHCNANNNLVVGYGKYEDTTSSFRRFERLHNAFYLMHEDSKTQAYRNTSYNLLLRKSEFLENGGFLGNLHLTRGEYDFLINKFAKENATALEISEDAWLIEDEPSDKTWLNKHLFYMESRKFLQHGAKHRLLYNIDQLAMHITYLLCIATITYASVAQNWILLGAAVIAFLTALIFRGILCRRALTDFGEDISPLKALFFEVTQVWHNVNYMIRYRLANKNDFTTHKL
ncbi:MAG: glycosyl transferase family 2 [Prevotella sp.]